MNYLAHIYLSGDDEDVLVGNFIADAVKGSSFSRYDQQVQKGIRLHRFIDHFTDNHPIVEQSKARIRADFRKYAGVIIDMYFDHFLAVQWAERHKLELSQFAQNSYQILMNRLDEMPEKIQFMLPYMQRHDWLTSYATLEGLGTALTGMSRRTTFESNMEHAVAALKEHYEQFENEFNVFFPILKDETNRELERLNEV